MSHSDKQSIDRTVIRATVRDVVEGSPVDRREVIETVADRTDHGEDIVDDEIDELERHGFVYLVGDGDSAEVRMP